MAWINKDLILRRGLKLRKERYSVDVPYKEAETKHLRREK